MNLKDTIKINKKIMALIKSKHSEDFPGVSTTPEARYYRRLALDTEEAESYLEANSSK